MSLPAGAAASFKLVLPGGGKLVNRAARAFAYQVLLAGAVGMANATVSPPSPVPVTVVVAGEIEGLSPAEVIVLASSHSRPLPALLVTPSGGGESPSIVHQPGTACQRIIFGSGLPPLSTASADLARVDLLTVLTSDLLTKGLISEDAFLTIEPHTRSDPLVCVLLAGLLGACLWECTNAGAHNSYAPSIAPAAREWYCKLLTTMAMADPSETVLAPHLPTLPSTSARRIKGGIAFSYDWTEERLPRSDRRNVLITAALPYVNNVPHLGNIIGAVLSADVFARYCRLRGYQTIYVGGTDEYGTATETKALEEGLSCPDLCAKYYKLHAAIYDWFGVQTDIFGRSSTPRQTAITHEIFQALYGNGYFFEQSVEQSFCETCARFLADRYVEGTCPHCSYADARGDQCDACGKLLNPLELKEARCKLCRTSPVVRCSNHLFLDLTKLQPVVEAFVEKASVAGHWSANSTSISRAWLTEGLKPRCMTRDLRWGTPVPIAGFEDKVFYVWFDACFGYISITANYTPDGWRKWWQSGRPGSPPVELFQFMGKDNVPFHTVIFPSTLLGTVRGEDESGKEGKEGVSQAQDSMDKQGDQEAEELIRKNCKSLIDECPWTLLHHINTTEYLNYESGKFSKSRGVGVFGNDARDSGIPVAVWRYYLLAMRPESTDSTFSWDDFGARTNHELLANLGNLVSRVSKFATSQMNGIVPPADAMGALEERLLRQANEYLVEYIRLMEGVHLRAALKCVMSISSLGNGYLTEAGLDKKLLASDPGRAGTIINIGLQLIYLVATLLEPFLPTTSEEVRTILNVPPVGIVEQSWEADWILPGHQLGTPFHLFTRLEEGRLAELRLKHAGKQVK